MSHEFKIVISVPADLSGAATAAPAFEKIEQQADNVAAAAAGLAGAADRLAQAAAGTPNAPLESLAAAARQTQAGAGTAGQPMAGLADASDDFLAKLETGFGRDSRAKIIAGVEEIGRAFTEAWQRGMEAAAGRQSAAVASGPSLAGDRSAGSTDLAAQLKDICSEIIGKLPAAFRAGLGDQPTDANFDAVSRAVKAAPAPANDPAAQEAKQGLIELLDRAVRLQANYHRAVQREGTPTAANLPPRQDASADAPERPRGTRQEIPRHPSKGAGDAAAPPTERHTHARRETFPTHGDHGGGDPGGGLHTGGLTTGSLGGVGTSTAAGVLASAPSYVPSFSDLPRPRPQLPSLLPTGHPLAQPLNVPTPAASIGATGVLGPKPPSGDVINSSQASAGDVRPGPSPGNYNAVSDAARQTTTAAQDAAHATSELSAALSSAFREQKQALQELKREMENLKGQIADNS